MFGGSEAHQKSIMDTFLYKLNVISWVLTKYDIKLSCISHHFMNVVQIGAKRRIIITGGYQSYDQAGYLRKKGPQSSIVNDITEIILNDTTEIQKFKKLLHRHHFSDM